MNKASQYHVLLYTSLKIDWKQLATFAIKTTQWKAVINYIALQTKLKGASIARCLVSISVRVISSLFEVDRNRGTKITRNFLFHDEIAVKRPWSLEKFFSWLDPPWSRRSKSPRSLQRSLKTFCQSFLRHFTGPWISRLNDRNSRNSTFNPDIGTWVKWWRKKRKRKKDRTVSFMESPYRERENFNPRNNCTSSNEKNFFNTFRHV